MILDVIACGIPGHSTFITTLAPIIFVSIESGCPHVEHNGLRYVLSLDAGIGLIIGLVELPVDVVANFFGCPPELVQVIIVIWLKVGDKILVFSTGVMARVGIAEIKAQGRGLHRWNYLHFNRNPFGPLPVLCEEPDCRSLYIRGFHLGDELTIEISLSG